MKIDLSFSLIKSEMIVAFNFLVASRVFLPCFMYEYVDCNPFDSLHTLMVIFFLKKVFRLNNVNKPLIYFSHYLLHKILNLIFIRFVYVIPTRSGLHCFLYVYLTGYGSHVYMLERCSSFILSRYSTGTVDQTKGMETIQCTHAEGESSIYVVTLFVLSQTDSTSPVSHSSAVLFLVEQRHQMTCSNDIQVPKPFGSRGFHKYSEIIL